MSWNVAGIPAFATLAPSSGRGHSWSAEESCIGRGLVRADPYSVPSSAARKQKSSLAISFVACEWPGCCECMEERRIDSDGVAYTWEEFALQYAPKTCKTVRWNAAPLAAPYCRAHIEARMLVFQKLSVKQPHFPAFAGWLLLHPEDDKSTLALIDDWLRESKLLFKYEHGDLSSTDYDFCIREIFCVDNKSSGAGRYTYNINNKVGDVGNNRKLLIHGTKSHNLSKILGGDLRLAGIEIDKVVGDMFGEGVYFADSFMKSMRYCDEVTCKGEIRKWVFLAEVNVGKPLLCKSVDQFGVVRVPGYGPDDATRPEITVAYGRRFFEGSRRLKSGWAEGCLIPHSPCGHASSSPCVLPRGRKLLFNEWVVRDPALYRLRYLVELVKDPY